MRVLARFVLLFLLLLPLAGCLPTASDVALQGQILLWHTWSEEETAVLNDLLAEFEALHPNVTVLQNGIPPTELPQQLETAVSSGLGPDLLIGNSRDLLGLAQNGQIRPLDVDDVQPEKFLPSALDSLRYQDAVYGLPLSLRPVALYYNTSLVETPARSVTGLLEAAGNGQNVALNSSFDGAFWGIQAFGGQLFSETGELRINEGGFVNWLSWLATAQDAPGTILSPDASFLVDQFAAEQVAYLVADPLVLSDLQQRLGRGKIGVAPLPAGPVGVSGPLLRVETLYFGDASSVNQQRLALELAHFLTRVEQSRTLMRLTGRVPANAALQVSEQAFPAIANFSLQARTAVPVQFYDALPRATEIVEQLYGAVLDGGQVPNEAVLAMLDQMGSDLTVATPTTQIACEQSGTLQIDHALSAELEPFLDSLGEAYEAQCPETEIIFQRVLPEDLLVVFQAKSRASSDAHLLIASDELLVTLVQADDIQPITTLTSPETLQRFLPASQTAAQFEGELYGLPFSLSLALFYVNNELVSNPPLSLNNLLTQTTIDEPVGLSLQFVENFWGIGAFGGLDRAVNGRYAPEQPALLAWLEWLLLAQDRLQVTVSDNENELLRQFANEQLALLVASSDRLAGLQTELGDRLTVGTLPSGAAGLATPLLQTQQLLFATNLSSSELALAYDFALFMTNQTTQQQMLTQTTLIPVNVTVNSEAAPLIGAVLTQAEDGTVWPKTAANGEIFEAGEALFEQVLLDGEDAETAVCLFIRQINALNGFALENESPCEQ